MFSMIALCRQDGTKKLYSGEVKKMHSMCVILNYTFSPLSTHDILRKDENFNELTKACKNFSGLFKLWSYSLWWDFAKKYFGACTGILSVHCFVTKLKVSWEKI